MLKNLSNIQGSKDLTKTAQKSILGGFDLVEYVSHCGPSADGLNCLTGYPHCPTGVCAGGVCSPHTNG
ncbi:MAG: hypothetical protein AAFQ94_02640 [Bacteroidota bacterium]